MSNFSIESELNLQIKTFNQTWVKSDAISSLENSIAIVQEQESQTFDLNEFENMLSVQEAKMELFQKESEISRLTVERDAAFAAGEDTTSIDAKIDDLRASMF